MFLARVAAVGLGIALPFMAASDYERTRVMEMVTNFGKTDTGPYCKTQNAEAYIERGWISHTLTIKNPDGTIRYVNDSGERQANLLEIEARAHCGAKGSRMEFVKASTNWWMGTQYTCKGVGGTAESEPSLVFGAVSIKMTLPNGNIFHRNAYGHEYVKAALVEHCSGLRALGIRLR